LIDLLASYIHDNVQAVHPIVRLFNQFGAEVLLLEVTWQRMGLIRTDARSAVGLREATRRGKLYRDAGAHGLYIEGLESAGELKKWARLWRARRWPPP
jgi:hypothetical protein